MDGGDALRWSAVAEDWAQLWGDFAWPAWAAMVAPVGVGTGTRVLDVGCGAGDLMDNLAGVGAEVAGIDPAPGMVAHT